MKINLDRKTRRVIIMPQPATNEQLLFGVFGAVGNPCALEFYCAKRDMRKAYKRVMEILK